MFESLLLNIVCISDASVQVTALIVLGCILASEPVIEETKQAMLKIKSAPTSDTSTTAKDCSPKNNFDLEFAEFSDSDSDDEPGDTSIPWLLKRCLSNLGIKFSDENDVSSYFIRKRGNIVISNYIFRLMGILFLMSYRLQSN